MKYTSAEAAKLLRKLNEEKNSLMKREELSSVFIAAVGENVEDVRPEYDYRKTQDGLEELDRKIRVLKHALNVFNLTQTVPGFDMTIDQVLVYIPQLSAQKAKLFGMASRLPRERMAAYGRGSSSIIEYSYANFDIAQAQADYEKVSEELARLQTALDVVNNTEQLELPF